MAGTENVTIEVKGMTCQHCVARVEKALKGVPGVHSVQVSLEDGSAAVEHSSDTTLDQLKQAIREAGYEAP